MHVTGVQYTAPIVLFIEFTFMLIIACAYSLQSISLYSLPEVRSCLVVRKTVGKRSFSA